LVGREQLIKRLQAERHARLVTIVAPAGYGKTTLMALWAGRETLPMGWLTLDAGDDDPARLLLDISAALGKAGMLLEADSSLHFTSDTAFSHGIPRLIGALGPSNGPGILVLDNIGALRRRGSIDAVGALLHQLPAGLQVAVTSRAEVNLPVASLRAQGRVLELTATDLAFTEVEAAATFAANGIHDGYDLQQVMERTEGWPAGIYLTVLAMKVGAGGATAPFVGGDDLYIADYLRHEILDHLSPSKLSFLTRTSILDQLSGPLCDAVLETTGSGRLLEGLERSNTLIMRMDRTRVWHRYHRMFQDLLRAELHLREPENVAALHARAAQWLDANGMPEISIHHAQAAGNADLVAQIVERIGRETFANGKSGTLLGWLEWLEGRGAIDRHPSIASQGVYASALLGDVIGAERWARYGPTDPISLIARAIQTRSGIPRMIEDVRKGRGGLPPGSGFHAGTLVIEGLARVWEGDAEKAETLFVEAESSLQPLVPALAESVALAQRAFIAIEDGDWSSAERHSIRSLRLVRDRGLEGYPTSALSFVAAARLARRRNDIARARSLLAQAASLRPRLNASAPGIAVQTFIELAKAYLELSDTAGARLVLKSAQGVLDQRPDLGLLPQKVEELKRGLTATPGRVGASTLTTAELRLLPLLATHLTFPEIGERLFISRHTVKTQAMSIYRKLGASSRSEAVQIAMESGLLGV
jgi:LuxR family maltose regulon positive regulatory protein